MQLLAHYQNEKNSPHSEIINWRENYLGDSLFYSYRSTRYDRQTYPASLHYHDYFELVVFVEGDIRYLCESASCRPQTGDIILIPPGQLHMSMLGGEATLYRRHVFYLYPAAFDSLGCGALTDFLGQAEGQFHLSLPPTERQELLTLLERLDQTLTAGDAPRERALAMGYAIQIFYLFGQARGGTTVHESCLPQTVLEIQRYLDAHFAELTSVTEVAAHFYYSREYVSRLFKQYFNTTVADYIRTRRIAHSQTLIAQGMPLCEVCFRVGFGNLTTFIRAFRAVTGMTPSQYRAATKAAAEG